LHDSNVNADRKEQMLVWNKERIISSGGMKAAIIELQKDVYHYTEEQWFKVTQNSKEDRKSLALQGSYCVLLISAPAILEKGIQSLGPIRNACRLWSISSIIPV
jgi:hypothetical protein